MKFLYGSVNMDIDIVLFIFGIIGTVAFAISGALIAIENKLDLLVLLLS